MQKEFIPYEQALELKELGFDEPCLAFYDGKGTNQVYYNTLRNGSGDYEPFKNTERLKWFGAPLYQQAFRWFRKEYKLSGLIEIGIHEYSFIIFDEAKDRKLINYASTMNGTYEEAELACLNKLIEIVKQ